MRAGDLKWRLTFRRAMGQPDAYGERDPVWTDLATVWAARTEVSDGERVRAQQTGAAITTRFHVRDSAIARTLTVADQLRFEGRLYDIDRIKPLDFREGFEITAIAQAHVVSA